MNPLPARGSVIQRIGQEPLGYKIKTPTVMTVGATPEVDQAKTQQLRDLAAMIGHTIETLRLRESMWKGAKEKNLAARLSSLSDPEKVAKIIAALEWNELPIPADQRLPALLADRSVQTLLAENPRLKLELGTLSASAKMAAIQDHARTVDQDVVGTRGLASRRFDPETLMADPILKMQMAQNSLALVGNQIKTRDGHVLIELFKGDGAFEQKAPADPRTGFHRPIYQKLGKDPGKANEYVRDDKGVYTRRYAYVEKNKYQFRDLANQGLLAGRYSTDPRPQTPRAYNQYDNYTRSQVPQLPRPRGSVASFVDAYELAYVHQELGSGAQQRGVSATSSPRHQIFSNQGESFRSKDGARLEVDLSRIPVGTNQAPQLINHYAHGARARMNAVTGSYYVDKGTHQRSFDHYQWSVKKNRELFIKEVKPEHLSAVHLHQTATGSSHSATSATGFDLRGVHQLGAQQMGLVEYNSGFADGSNNRPNRPPPVRPTYYAEGYGDGAEYRRGYLAGGRRGAPLPDALQIRYSQGFWDGRHGRRMRTS